MEIGHIEVDANQRRQGYGEGAMRIIMVTFRSSSRSNLVFDHFWLTVGLGNDRAAARSLYEKLGFSVEKKLEHIGYQYMILTR